MTIQRPAMVAHFVPGQSVGLVTAGAVALVATDRRSQLVDDLWAAMVRRAPFDEVVELLLATGLRNLPPLALISVDGATTRALVRGDMVARLAREGHADVVIDGSTVSTWLERTEADVETVEAYPTHDLSEPAGFFVTDGVVPATRFRCAIGVSKAANPFRPSGSHTPSLSAGSQRRDIDAGAMTTTEPERPHEASAVGDGTPVAVNPPLDDLVPVESATNGTAHDVPADSSDLEQPPSGVHEHGGGAEDIAAPTSPDDTSDDAGGSSTLQFRPEPDDHLAHEQHQISAEGLPPQAAGAAQSTADVGVEGEEDDDEYDHLFGATQFRPIADAGLRPDEDDVPGAPGAGGVISAVPPSAPLSGPPAEHPPHVDQSGDHDGMTISLSELRNARSGAAEAAAAPALGSTVHAVSCPIGHLNPPTASSCRVCGIEIPDQAHVSVPRPPLGTLRFSDGTTRVLSRPMLLGRSPTADGPVSGELPELVSLTSPSKELSGLHLEVRIEGWQVLVVDRHSTNGTTVRLPGRDPIRMHPGEPVPIVPGTEVDMAEEVQFTFEADE